MESKMKMVSYRESERDGVNDGGEIILTGELPYNILISHSINVFLVVHTANTFQNTNSICFRK